MSDEPIRLTLLGYWSGPDAVGSWPSPAEFVDLSWNEDDRDFIASYLWQGQVARAYMGYSRCRFCGQDNGDLELSDGTFVWPSGLAHYITEHGVRLPEKFVQHAHARTESLEEAERDLGWWTSATPPPPTAAAADAPADREEDPGSQNRTVLWPHE